MSASPFIPGSFRGAAFLFDASQYQAGRRVALHEFPTPGLPDKPAYPEDLGRKAEQFNLTVFVMESAPGAADWGAQRDALIAAISAPGSGTLIHPIWGRMTVQVIGQASVTESAARIGIVDFVIPFVRAATLTLAGAATGQAAVASAQAAQASAQANFSGAAASASTSSFVSEQAATDVVTVVDQLAEIVAGTGAPAAAVYAWHQQAAALTAQGGTLFAASDQGAAQIAALVTAISLLFVPADANGNPTVTGWQQQLNYPTVGMSQASVAVVLASQLQAAQLQPQGKLPLAITAPYQQMAANRAALYALITEIALGEAVCAALATQFTSSDQAVATRDQVATLLAAQSLHEADLFHDRVASSLDAARIALVQQIDNVAAQLPEVVSVTPPQTVSSVVLAHRLYDNPAGDADILARNPGIVHPLFIPGGVALSVLAP